jgi:hypothetical protein
MIRLGSRRHSSAALLLRRLSTSDDHARRRAALDKRLVDQSPLRDAGSAYRDRSDEFATPPPAGRYSEVVADALKQVGLLVGINV